MHADTIIRTCSPERMWRNEHMADLAADKWSTVADNISMQVVLHIEEN